MSSTILATSTLAILIVSATAAAARDQVQLAGSFSVLLYATIVAELFGENTDFPTPVTDSGGSSAGLNRFSEGVGARIASNKDGIGVFGLWFYENNTAKLQVATMNGIAPSADTIASGAYPVSRPIFFYVKHYPRRLCRHRHNGGHRRLHVA